MTNISYKENKPSSYKYTLLADVVVQLEHFKFFNINTEYFTLEVGGKLTIKRGYSWDGLTGWWDRYDWLKASLIHDALLQMIYDEGLIAKVFVDEAHKEMLSSLKTSTSLGWAYTLYFGVVLFHKPFRFLAIALSPSN